MTKLYAHDGGGDSFYVNNKEVTTTLGFDTLPVKQTVKSHKAFIPQLVDNQLRIFIITLSVGMQTNKK